MTESVQGQIITLAETDLAAATEIVDAFSPYDGVPVEFIMKQL